MPRGSTSTSSPKPTLEQALGNVPDQFRKRLIPSFLELKTRFREGKLDAAGLSAGKFCETVIRLLQHQLTGKFVPFGDKIPNLADACSALEKTPSSPGIESLRVIIPRALLFLYTLRNKRGIGHVGGDVDANRIDLATIMRAADWIVCELIRVFHTLSLEEAQDIVDSLAQRELPDIWEVAGKKRVLRPELSAPDKVLVLLYSEEEQAIPAEDLFAWVEYSSMSKFRERILDPLHDKQLVEYDRDAEMVHLSPLGIRRVEDTLLKAGSAA